MGIIKKLLNLIKILFGKIRNFFSSPQKIFSAIAIIIAIAFVFWGSDFIEEIISPSFSTVQTAGEAESSNSQDDNSSHAKDMYQFKINYIDCAVLIILVIITFIAKIKEKHNKKRRLK